ncbi:hypothetical protein Noda2021_07210 [Candidatus Dependentiae bacterium Noda2021]|nr:hypothetical protein Noda2021_07210 [Candidatus Dependentiae bacterium Noda2021]
MPKVSLRQSLFFLSLSVLFTLRASENQILFTTNQVDQLYAQVTAEIKSLYKRLDGSVLQDTPGMVALSAAINDESIEFMPLELMLCAVHDIRSQSSLSLNERTHLDSYYQQLINLDEQLVRGQESLRAHCKTFNQLCVRGNARIGGNLIVCGIICPDPRTGQAGAGEPGATGNTGFTGFTGSQGAVGALGALGSIGDTGATGLTGFTGPQGAAGAAGAQGETGNTGSTGLTGFTGLTGNVGPAGIPANESLYASYYFTGATSVTGGSSVNGSGAASVPFTNQGPVNGFNLIDGTDIQVTTTGTYEITFQAITEGEANLFGLAVNDVLIAVSSIYTSGQKIVSPYNLMKLTRSCNAGDIINIKNIGVALSPSVTISGPAGLVRDRATASIMIRQIF